MRAVNKNIIVEPIQKEKEGSIYLVNEDILSGTVLSVGDKVLDIEVGDTVFFNKFAYDKNCFFEYEGRNVLMLPQSTIEYYLKS
jgi:co-chaperonin GroES (HSP10)